MPISSITIQQTRDGRPENICWCGYPKVVCGHGPEINARFMLESMKKESKLLQDELDSDKKENKEKEMSDEDIQKLAEALGTKVGESLAPVTEKLDAILEKVGSESTDEEEADTDTETDTDTEGDDETKSKKSAKGGDDDQLGADEVDEDTELTPEQEKEFEKEFAKSLEKELA